MNKQTVGFIGLGAMGLPMAVNLVKAGFQVRGCDLAQVSVNALVAAGGQAAATPAEAAHDANLLALMVATAEQAESALFGAGGALRDLAQGATVVLFSTVPPDYARQLGERLAGEGLHFLDAPVSGGTVGAQAGKLAIMAAGSAAAFQAAEPILNALGARVYRLGERPGMGSEIKMINQLLAGVHIVSTAEALALATRLGADPRLVFDIISNSAGNSWMFQNRGPRVLEDDPEVTSAVDIFVKDLGIVVETARQMRFPTPLAAAACQQFIAAAAAGLGRADDSQVVKVYEMLAGISVAKAAGKPK